MYQVSYFLLFYIIEILTLSILLLFLFFSNFFSYTKEPIAPKTTLDLLIDQIKNSNEDKEVLDSVMHEFYTHFYNISSKSSNFNTWLKLIQEITLLDYMSVEQAAQFRDDLSKKNPSIKQEIKQAIGISLKYREDNKKKRK
ncbi:hypothetical protein CQA42_03065 [Helicobacter sp. MIT 99-5507]|nr:hypothetical protein CQA42_03065 [Helicobacter sp. MIT 99-5507]